MKLKEGYKQTEIAIIPVDWELKLLKEIGVFKKGKGIKKDSTTNEGLPCIRYGEIYTRYNEYTKMVYSYINSETAKNSQKIKDGDLLFAGSGETTEEIGKCVAYLCEQEGYAGGDIIIFSPEGYDSKFLGFLMNYRTITKQKSRMGQGDAVVHIYPSNLSKIYVPLPPTKEEQSAIAQVLSDTDELITSLEKLIAKKRLIKKGIMQQLLTGKKRLPGFNKDWSEKALGEFCEFTQGIQIPMKEQIKHPKDGYVRYLYIRDFFTNDFLWYVKDNYPTKMMTEEDIMMVNTGNSSGSVYSGATGVLSNNAFKITFNSKIITSDFLFLFLSSELTQRNIKNKFNSAGQPHVGHKNIAEIMMKMPVDIDEQKAVARIVQDIDSEIEVLEQKVNKYKSIKQGMMQELLTGKTRLI